MKNLNVKMVVSTDRVKLVINDNLVFDGESLDAESLLRYIQNEAIGPVNLQTHYEWTMDMDLWEKDNSSTATLSPGKMEVIEIGEADEQGL